MLLLTCKCLNIKVHMRGTENDYKRIKEESVSEDNIPTGFFPAGELEVELDGKGIKQEHNYLVHRRAVGDYTIFRCLSCGLDSYALKPGALVIVNSQLLAEASVIERLSHSPQFSQVFQMVMLNKDTTFAGAMPDPKSSSYESLQSHLNSIQQQLTDFLIQEEAAMETRVRFFEESQKNAFSELQQKLKEEKKKMVSLLLASSNLETSSSREESPGRSDSAKRPTDVRKSPAKKKPLGRMKSLPPILGGTPDQDDMFGFDGFEHDNDETFYPDSDSEDDDTAEAEDDSISSPVNVRRAPGAKPKLMYSSSVPISVPAWNKEASDNWLTEEESTPQEPDQIAASMQALAQSITDDNRYIFGDRPRPRLNTGDFNNR